MLGGGPTTCTRAIDINSFAILQQRFQETVIHLLGVAIEPDEALLLGFNSFEQLMHGKVRTRTAFFTSPLLHDFIDISPQQPPDIL